MLARAAAPTRVRAGQTPPMHRLEGVFARWARTTDDVRALLVIGSQARTGTPADEWSDLDLVVAATTPSRWLDDGAWLDVIGPVGITYIEPTPILGLRERRVLFADGADCDLVVVDPELLARAAQAPATLSAAVRGYRLLLDKDGQLGRLAASVVAEAPAADHPLDRARFDEVAADFWHHAVWIARKLARGELFVATSSLAGRQAQLLREAIEWNAAGDAWFRGRFLERWAGADVLDALRGAFPTYDRESVARSLTVVMDLFSRLSREVAAEQGFDAPIARYESVARRYVGEALAR